MPIATEPFDAINKGKWKEWPCPIDQLERGREFLKEIVSNKRFTIIVPDKDADGLSAALIIYRTLAKLGLPEDLMHVHFLNKGNSVHSDTERDKLETVIKDRCREGQADQARIVIVDQGSRPGRPIVRSKSNDGVGENITVETLIIDHHQSTQWPEESTYVTACHSSPICTSSLLTYLLVSTLHSDLLEDCAWPALIGIYGDLGQSEIKFGKIDGVWPITKEMLLLGNTAKIQGKKELGEAVGMLNAPRRTGDFNVIDAWKAILSARKPADILCDHALNDCRQRVNLEIERCTHAAPKFSKDSRVALLRINSKYQVHPVIATRWAGTLSKSKKLQCIMVVNPGHHPDPNMTSFSCRIVSGLRRLPESERPNLRLLLKEYARKTAPDFLDRVGQDFASGHNEATGGIIRADYFEEFVSQGMEIGVPDPESPAEVKKRKMEEQARSQTNLKSFFTASPSKRAKICK